MSFPRVGVIGAGQLARMMAVAANDLGIDFKVFAAIPNDSAAQVSHFVLGDYSDIDSVLDFAKGCDVLTFEHELVPQGVIRAVEAAGIKVYPRSESFTYSQDKLEMRRKITELNLPNPKWQKYQGKECEIGFPLIAKLPAGGYDGRGVFQIDSEAQLHELHKKTGMLLLEEKINFDYEISVMVARSPHNQAATWPATLTIQSNGICTSTVTPVPEISDLLANKVQAAALEIASGISLVGVMAVEMFIVGDDFYINELALRPHNSGHWTIEGCLTSQFEQHLRAILDLPLGSTAMRSKFAVMGNVLGGAKSDMYRPYLHLMARTPELKFHQYGKEVKPGRKIGHVTMCGENLLQLQQEVTHAVDYMNGVIDE
ncbi:MAG: 5-(carboxyamino)imidazole ribonucleotide synthase [Actinomycetes bacterium]